MPARGLGPFPLSLLSSSPTPPVLLQLVPWISSSSALALWPLCLSPKMPHSAEKGEPIPKLLG